MRRTTRACWMAVVIAAAATAAADLPIAATGATPSFVTAKTYPYPQNAPGPISCAGPRFCMQIAFGMLPADVAPVAFARTTDDAGATWTSRGRLPLPRDDTRGFSANGSLTCASPKVCVFVDEFMELTTDGGTSWVIPSGALFGFQVACAPGGGCLAVGNPSGHAVRALWSSGSSGTFRSMPAVTGLPTDLVPSALACTAASRCVLAGAGAKGVLVAVTSSAGPRATWHVERSAAEPRLSSLSCGSPQTCVGVATVYTSPKDMTSVQFLEQTSNAGATWSRNQRLATEPSGQSTDLTGVSCATSLVCAASSAHPVGSNPDEDWTAETYVSRSGGASWRRHTLGTLAFPLVPLAAASCVSTGRCFADDWNFSEFTMTGAMEASSDATTWSVVAIPPTDAANLSLDCTVDDTCWRIDVTASATTFSTELLHSFDDGTTWTEVSVPPGIEPVKLAGCQSATTCELIGIEGAALYQGLEGTLDTSDATAVLLTTTDGGATWTSDPIPIIGGALPEFATCTSASACVTVVQDETALDTVNEIVATTNGATWTTTTLPDRFEQTSVFAAAWGTPGALDCTFSGFCILGSLWGSSGSSLDVSSDGGHTWKTVATPSPYATTEGVQCFGTDSCDVEYWVQAPTNVIAFAQTTDGGTNWVHRATLVKNVYDSAGADLSCTALLECTSVVGGIGISPTAPVTVEETSNGGATWVPEGWTSPIIPKSPKKLLGEILVAFLSCSSTACLVATELALGDDIPGSTQLTRMAR